MLTDAMTAILTAAGETGWVLEPDAKRILDLAGIPVPKFHLATTIDDAVQAAGKTGYPVAAKAVSPAVIHKTDVGGVILNINTPEDVKNSFESIIKNVKEYNVECRREIN